MLLSRSPSGPKKYFPIPVGRLEEEIRARSADDGKMFREEFHVSVGPSVRRRGAGQDWDAVRVTVNVPQARNSCLHEDTVPQDWLGPPSFSVPPLTPVPHL